MTGSIRNNSTTGSVGSRGANSSGGNTGGSGATGSVRNPGGQAAGGGSSRGSAGNVTAMPTTRVTLTERLRDAKLAKDAAEEAYRELCREWTEAHDFGIVKENGVSILKRRGNRTLDKKKAEELYGERVMELVVTPAAVKRALGSDEADALYRESEPVIVVTFES